ncbi:MAG: InlB B-repeat-containing protein [Lachnospiraceae bacterium]|nr:InlB B-repeat-containing protein [Lachnospiraceae bacterium]
MRKKSEKIRMRLMALLTAICMLSSIPYTPVTVSASESVVSIETEDNGVLDQAENLGSEKVDIEKTENATEDVGQTEDVKESDADDSGKIKDADEPEKDGSEQTEEQEKESGSTEGIENPDEKDQTGEMENGKEENPEDSGEEDSGTGEGDESEQDGEEPEQDGEELEEEESEEAEQPDEMETEETEDEEIVEDSEETLMLLSEETGDEEGSGEEYVTDDTYTDENGVVYHYYGYEDGTANIYELESYKENSVNIPESIDGYTVTQLTFAIITTGKITTVTIPETVKYIGCNAFRWATIGTVYYNAPEAETGATSVTDGCFYSTQIDNIVIGEDVKILPDYLFASASVTMDELVLNNVEKIGMCVFYSSAEITDLIIGENVKEISVGAFKHCKVTNVYYNAVHAEVTNDTLSAELNTVLPANTYSHISFGERVEVIPDCLLNGSKYTADSLEIPDSVKKIGTCAFYGSGFNIGELTIGKNVNSIGLLAFERNNIGILNYNAREVEIPGIAPSLHHRNPFYAINVGELRIGDNVEVLPDYLFYCIKLDQEELVIPDSVTYIGSEVLSCSADNHGVGKISIGTLVIGENVSHMGAWAFGKAAYDKVIVYATESDSAVMPYYYASYMPVCGSVEIHGNAASYKYFTAETEEENITLMCEDFETTYGEEYYDWKKDCFVTVITDSCVVCGYEIVNEEYDDAYTVLFQRPGGFPISCQYVHRGENAVEPEAPERTGYEFTGWDKDFTNVTSNLTVTAQYKVKTFSIVFKDGEDIISEQEIEYECDAEVPENPTRPEEEWGRWKFIGWNGNYRDIIQDEIIQAQFEKVLNEYEVVFRDAEGNVISRQTVTHGESAEVPDAPEKKATAKYTYTFTGWNGDTDNVTGSTDFYPVYEAITCSYTVTFVNGEEILSTQSVEYGKAAKAPEDVAEKTGYDFIGWDKDYTNVVSDMTVSAQYKIKSFNVSFKDNETIISKQKIEYGSDAKLPQNPTRPEEEWGTWKFIGWDGNYKNVIQDEVVQAQFEKVFNEYEVVFYDAEGNVLSRQNVTHGESAVIPAAPEKEATAQYSYTFTKWNGDTENITGNTGFYPVYDAKLRSYTVTFMNGDTVLDIQAVEYGKSATAPEDPERAEEEWGTWKFAGWDGDYTNIAKDMTIQAQFEQVFHEYEVIFYDAGGNILSRQTVEYGHAAKAPEAPEKEPTEEYCYPFTGWDGDITNITADAVFYPTYGMETRTYTVTFMNGDTVFDTQEVEYGASAVTPAEPKKKADAKYTYNFIGWDSDYSVITGNMVIHALYEKKEIPSKGKPKPGKGDDTKKKDDESGGGGNDESGGGNGGGDGTEPVPDNGGEKPEPETEEENVEITDDGLGKIMEKQTYNAEIQEGTLGEVHEAEEYAEIVKGEVLHEDTENVEGSQETGIEDVAEDDRDISVLGWFLLFVGIVVSGCLLVWLLLLYLMKRKVKVCGKILDESGCVPCGIQLTLSGKDIMETEPDEAGFFSFEGIKKDYYGLNVYNEDGAKIFSADIRMEVGSGVDVFMILESDCSNVETGRKMGRYEVNLTV